VGAGLHAERDEEPRLLSRPEDRRAGREPGRDDGMRAAARGLLRGAARRAQAGERSVPEPCGGPAHGAAPVRTQREDQRLARTSGVAPSVRSAPVLRGKTPAEAELLDEHVIAEAERAAD